MKSDMSIVVDNFKSNVFSLEIEIEIIQSVSIVFGSPVILVTVTTILILESCTFIRRYGT